MVDQIDQIIVGGLFIVALLNFMGLMATRSQSKKTRQEIKVIKEIVSPIFGVVSLEQISSVSELSIPDPDAHGLIPQITIQGLQPDSLEGDDANANA